ncbi:AAA family ATPase [Shinella daejeonensis]|uniref:AAA family ATPase n=1 Tax=Shinella daejeonensis TaxID=659017 RepID=UPI0020C7C9CA|nr:AAA family ATPase [Shinella daejeonensis]MCP8897187.1 AAA family ATPase [Shinella daejeonensis]
MPVPSDLVVHINGWPGTGKLTIARLLAERIDARLLDNHTLINPAEAVFSRRDPLNRSLRQAIRGVVFEHLLRAPPGSRYIFTDALSDDDQDTAVFEQYRDLAARRGAVFVAVVLDCAAEENRRRLTGEDRARQRKLVDPAVLEMLRSHHRLLRAEADIRIGLDVTGSAAGEVALEIASRLG